MAPVRIDPPKPAAVRSRPVLKSKCGVKKPNSGSAERGSWSEKHGGISVVDSLSKEL
jgi:hypothetical protein